MDNKTFKCVMYADEGISCDEIESHSVVSSTKNGVKMNEMSLTCN